MAIIFNDKRGKRIKVDHNHNYGGFWLDTSLVNVNYEGRTGASTVVKALKLRNYQRAIANFVKILSQRDVPVTFQGSDSYTDNSRVVIAGNVSDKNFDITAGLALHEASHLKYTDFDVIKNLVYSSNLPQQTLYRIKSMINWIEDRRIDSLVFKSCPGYKAYYHKLYDHYFRTKAVSQMLKSKKYRTETYDNYEAHIINMMSVDFKSSSLQILPLITSMIDVNNILRLNNTQEVSELAIEIVQIIEKHLESLAQEQQEQQQPDNGTGSQGGSDEGDDNQDNESQDSEDQDDSNDDDSNDGQEQDSDNDLQSDNADGQDEQEQETELTDSELREIANQLAEQKALINGQAPKQSVSGKIEKQLQALQNTETDYTAVGSEGKYDCLIYRLDKEVSKVAALYSLKQQAAAADTSRRNYVNVPLEMRQSLPTGLYNLSGRKDNSLMVAQGFQLGAILGRKIQTRRESRELVTNRLRTGKIDVKRVAHAGYGIENIFNQIHIDKYNKANIHLTIDASGSMSGGRWDNSLKMAMALGKAVDMIEGINLQVSMRETTLNGQQPVVSILYDSRTNKLNHLKMLLEMYQCDSLTPEGLCLEAMLNKKLLVPSTPDCDSYLINICDGEPGMNNGYGGQSALQHTKNQVKRINNELGIKHAGYFFGGEGNSSYTRFTQMYGKTQSIAIPDASNATIIAAHMNKQLMQK